MNKRVSNKKGDMTDRKLERAARFVRTRKRQPDFVRKAGPMRSRKAYDRHKDAPAVDAAIEEWAEDYAGEASIFED